MKKSTYIEYDSKIVWEKNSTKILPFSGSSNVFELISGSASISICTLPAHRTPSFINSRTTVFINLKAMRVERWLESNFSSKIDTKHSISVIPANLVQTYEWQQPVSFAALTIV